MPKERDEKEGTTKKLEEGGQISGVANEFSPWVQGACAWKNPWHRPPAGDCQGRIGALGYTEFHASLPHPHLLYCRSLAFEHCAASELPADGAARGFVVLLSTTAGSRSSTDGPSPTHRRSSSAGAAPRPLLGACGAGRPSATLRRR